MRAAVMQGLHKPLIVETVPDPKPGAGEVLVKVGRCGICGSDLHMTEDPAYGQGAGSILGHEFAGEVIELGKGVEGLAKGDLVAVSPLKSCGSCPACRKCVSSLVIQPKALRQGSAVTGASLRWSMRTRCPVRILSVRKSIPSSTRFPSRASTA